MAFCMSQNRQRLFPSNNRLVSRLFGKVSKMVYRLRHVYPSEHPKARPQEKTSVQSERIFVISFIGNFYYHQSRISTFG